MNTQQQNAEELVDTFSMLEDWEDRYRFLIDLGKELPPLPDEARAEENRVHGCQSNVWMIASSHIDGEKRVPVIDFLADSDAHIVRGLIAVLRRVYSGHSAQEIVDFDIEKFFGRLDLVSHLSPGRRNGLSSMLQRIRMLAAQESTRHTSTTEASSTTAA